MEIAALASLVSLALAAPLTLDDALALAARQNADLLAARADADSASADARQAYAGVLPRLDLNGSFGRQYEGAQDQVNVVPNPTPPPDFVRQPVTIPSSDVGLYSLGLALTWTFFDGLASWNAISASKARHASARRQVDETALAVSFAVTQRFYELLKQQRTLEVRRESAALSAELVRRADALFTAGRGTKADTYSARVNLGNDQLAVETQLAVLARARSDLASALGLGSPAGLEVAAPADLLAPGRAPDTAAPPPLEALLAQARRNRPLVQSRRLAGEAADLEVTRARGAYWPTLGVQASYTRQSPDLSGRTGLFGASLSHQYLAVAQLVLGWNLFAGGETAAGVDRAAAQARRAQALLEQGEQTAAAEVTVAREQVVTLVDSLKTAQQIDEAAELGLRFAREQLDAGRGSQLEVRDAVVKRTQARLTWVSTVLDLVVARADLNRAVGGVP